MGSLAALAAAEAIDNKSLRAVAQISGVLGFGAWMNGFGRDLEDQANRVGLRYAYQGGYNVERAPSVWQRFLEKYGEGNKVTNFFFSDHSSAGARRKNLEQELRFNYSRSVASMVRTVTIDRGDVGTRIDRVLLRHLRDVPGISRNRIQRLIAAGAVLVNDKPAPRVSWRLAAGDRLSIELPETARRQRPRAESLPLDVIFEDDDLIAVNKPAGQVAHPAFKNTTGTLLNALLAHAAAEWAPTLVNRLDKDTSGLVLVAKRPEIQTALQHAMQRDAVEKDYLAIVRGKPAPKRGLIDLALDRDPWDRRRVMVRDRGGQPSVTRYERLVTSPDETTSLVRCRLITGRTHQIRVHLAARTWPILGDAVYGVKDQRLSRQALHAWRLAFDHPTTGDHVTLFAPVPDDLRAVLHALSLPFPEFSGFSS
jgi:23S rRNA pseudouridine1911/1915/1917 synthase